MSNQMSADETSRSGVATCVKGVIVVHFIRDRIMPVVIAFTVKIQDARIPINIASENHMRKGGKFIIRVWTHGKMRQAVPNTEGKDVTIHSLNALQTTRSANRPVIDIVGKGLKLAGRMNRSSLLRMAGVLMQDSNDIPSLRSHNSSGRDNRN